MLSAKQPAGCSPATQLPPFWRYVLNVCEYHAEELAGSALAEWAGPFEMARHIRLHADSQHHKPMAIAQRAHRDCRALRAMYPSDEDFVQEFMTVWDKVKVLPGFDLLGSAAEQSTRFPLNIHKERQADVTDGYKRFISFCAHLCIGVGSDRIKLPCREVGQALGVMPKTVSCYRQQAVKQSYLIELRAHKYGGPERTGEATLFRFRVEYWDWLKERVKPSGK